MQSFKHSPWQVALLCGISIASYAVNATGFDVHSNHEHAGHDHSRPDAHAPIGVMGDHLMGEGEWMVSYRYMQMHMEGMRTGTDDISSDAVALLPNSIGGEEMRMGSLPDGSPRIMTVPGTYRIVPLEMDMKMHMLGMMYGFNDDVTGMVMVNYIQNEMTSRTYDGMMGTTVVGDFSGETSGIGDTVVSALIRLDKDKNSSLHFNAGVSLPTGSIDESGSVLPPFAGTGMAGTTPGELEMVEIDRLGYSMQLGSGTVDLIPGITYYLTDGDASYGAQAKATLRFYDNSEDYRLGNRYEATGWAARRWATWASTSIRLALISQDGIKGRDTTIKGGSTVANPDNYGRDQADLSVGLNLLGSEGSLKGQRLALELGAPVYEKVDGVQMSHDWTVTLGWQSTF